MSAPVAGLCNNTFEGHCNVKAFCGNNRIINIAAPTTGTSTLFCKVCFPVLEFEFYECLCVSTVELDVSAD